MVLCPGETPRWESGAAKSPGREGEGEAGQTCCEFQQAQTFRPQHACEQTWLFILCTLQEEKERKEQEEQRKKLDDDAKKKKVLSNRTQQYGAAQKVQTSENKNPAWIICKMNAGCVRTCSSTWNQVA